MATSKSIVLWEHLQAAITDLWSRMSAGLARKVNSSTYTAGVNALQDKDTKLQQQIDALAQATADASKHEVIEVENQAALDDIAEPQAEVIYITADTQQLFLRNEEDSKFVEVTGQTIGNTIYVSNLAELANRTYTETGMFMVVHAYSIGGSGGRPLPIRVTHSDVYTLNITSMRSTMRKTTYTPTLSNKDGWAERIYDKNNDTYVWKWHYYAYMEEGTYKELKDLADSGQLKAGTHYHMTDFMTTVANDDEARSAGHQFDLILLAVDDSTFSHLAKATPHAGDTYFANANIAAWQLWYDINNDTNRYHWANAENGKGVIYRMIDEHRNDCPYDFKNVQFKRYRVTSEIDTVNGQYYAYNGNMQDAQIGDYEDFKWAYTFNLKDENGDWVDYSVQGEVLYGETDWGYLNQTKKGRCEENIVRQTMAVVTIDEKCYRVLALNNIVHISTISDGYEGLQNEMIGNYVGYGCYNITLKDNPEQNHLGNKCHSNIIGSYANTFGNYCDSLTFGNDCSSLTFGNYCSSLTFGNYCDSLTFGNGCSSLTFGNGCSSLTFGNYCSSLTFGNYLRYITVFDGVQNVAVTGGNSRSNYVQNAQILSGVRGSNSNNKLQINFVANANYTQVAGLKLDGTLRIFNPAEQH